VQRSAHNLAQHLARRGHDVSIAAHAPGRFGISRARANGLPVLGLNVPSPFTLHPSYLVRRYALDALNVAALATWCRARRVRVVHCHLINVDTRYALSLARLAGVRIVVTLRGGETEHWLETHPARSRYIRRILERADRVTAVASDLLRQACTLSPSVADKSTVIPNAAVPAALVKRAGEGSLLAAARQPYVLFVGRLEEMKDVPVLIDAFAHACAEPSFPHTLVVAGSGSLEPELRRRAQDGAARDRIVFVGSTSYADTLRVIRDATVLVLPSRSSEGCPNVALEAMALGTPVIVSDLPSLVEVVGGGDAGAIFPRGDARALADRLVVLTSDTALRDRYVLAAKQRLDMRHRVDDVVSAYERIYESVAGRAERIKSS
jgi:phosphatidylinositol alpha-mannosyltransferase